jgi:hypothetical protein
MKDNSSQISKTKRYLMFLETEILKDKMFTSGRDMEVQTRDGELSMKLKKLRKELKEWVDMDSESVDHSTSDQDSQ